MRRLDSHDKVGLLRRTGSKRWRLASLSKHRIVAPQFLFSPTKYDVAVLNADYLWLLCEKPTATKFSTNATKKHIVKTEKHSLFPTQTMPKFSQSVSQSQRYDGARPESTSLRAEAEPRRVQPVRCKDAWGSINNKNWFRRNAREAPISLENNQ